MGWFTNNFIKCNFSATEKIDKEVVYRFPLRHNLKSRYPYINCVILNDKYATDTMFAFEPSLPGETCKHVYAWMK